MDTFHAVYHLKILEQDLTLELDIFQLKRKTIRGGNGKVQAYTGLISYHKKAKQHQWAICRPAIVKIV